MRLYLASVEAVEKLSAEEERRLAARITDGDPEAHDHFISHNLGLVVFLARHVVARGILQEDLVAEGNLGLIRATKGYDGRSKVHFATYASFWIKQSMRRLVINQGRIIRLPHHTIAFLARWRRARLELIDKLGCMPTNEEINTTLDLSNAKLRITKDIVHAAELKQFVAKDGEDIPDIVAWREESLTRRF